MSVSRFLQFTSSGWQVNVPINHATTIPAYQGLAPGVRGWFKAGRVFQSFLTFKVPSRSLARRAH